MIKRSITERLEHLFEQYPVLTITGPRQSGKTTLAKSLFSHLPYINLERTLDREFASAEPERFLQQFPDGAVIDEVQNVPELLSNIQVIVDEDGRNSLFVLTGSHNPSLMKNTAQSLAGRTALVKLLPFSIKELSGKNKFNIEEQLFTGFYPRIIDKKMDPTEYYGNYVETYIDRDIRSMIQLKNKSLFVKFLTVLAGRVGQLINKGDLARDVGVAASTIEEWISLLETTYIVHRLTPWFQNINKRMTKSPKLYFYDVGLCAYLLGINDVSQVTSHPLRGNLFENMQIIEALKWKYNSGNNSNFHFLRSAKGQEIDLLINKGNDFLPIEIKSSTRFDSTFLKGFKIIRDLNLNTPWGEHLVLGIERSQNREDVEIHSWKNLSKFLEALSF